MIYRTEAEKEVRETEDKKLKAIFESMQGITLLEWQKLKQAIDDAFRSEVAKQNNKIPMATSEKLIDSYKGLFWDYLYEYGVDAVVFAFVKDVYII